ALAPDLQAFTQVDVLNIVRRLVSATLNGAKVKSCGARKPPPQFCPMDIAPQRPETLSDLPLHPQDEVECRRCAVHCDKVVYPSTCLARSCPFVYAYEEH